MDLTYISLLLHEFGFPRDKVLKVSTVSWIPHSTCGMGCRGLLALLFAFLSPAPVLAVKKQPKTVYSFLSHGLPPQMHPGSVTQASDLLLSFSWSFQAGSEN